MGISRATLNVWKDKHADILDTLKKGKEVVDYEVQNALYEMCVGKVVKLRKPVKIRVEHVKPGGEKFVTDKIEYVEEETYIPPNPIAIIFWMKVRKKWNDRVVDDGGNAEALERLDDVLAKIKGGV